MDLDGLVEVRALERLDEVDRLGGLVLVVAIDAGPRLQMLASVTAHDTTSTPIERAVPAMILLAASMSLALRSSSFLRRDLAQLRLGDLADLRAVRLARALVDADRLADEHRGGRRLRDERERAVLVDGDHDRDDGAGVLLGLGVERLAELHDVDAVLTERGPTGGAGLALPPTACSLMVVRTFFAMFSTSFDATRTGAAR